MNVYTLLTSLEAVTGVAGQNIYPMVVPDQCAYPALTYQVIARVTNPGVGTPGIIKLRVQFESFAKDYATADSLRVALVQSLTGYRGAVADVNVQATQVIGAYDYFEDEIELYRLVVEAYFWFN